MNLSNIVSQIIGALTAPLGDLLTKIPQAIVTAFQAMFMVQSVDSSGTVSYSGVNDFALTMLIFGGIALAFGLTKLVFNLVRNKVGR